jgi:Short C-terminal domain/zinc-ribbon family
VEATGTADLSLRFSPIGGSGRGGQTPCPRSCFNCDMVIFGFGPGKQEDLGEVAPAVCPNCHNQVFLHHVQSKKRVSLYFVPVVPYGTDHYLVCPVCSRGLQISSPQMPYIQSMSSATKSFRTGRLGQPQYMAQVERFWRQLGVSPAGQQLLMPSSPGASTSVPPPPPPQQPQPPPPGAAGGPAAAAQSPPVAEDDQASWIAQLQTLAQLHDQGLLSDADYEAAKRRVLEQK